MAFATGGKIRIIKLAEHDAACSEDGGVAAATAQAAPMLEVRVRGHARCERVAESGAMGKRLPDAAVLELSMREFKAAAAAAATIQLSHRQRERHKQRQHLWKLAGALLAATIRPDHGGELEGGADPEGSALQSARRREAILSWLRLALAESASTLHAKLPAADVGARALELVSSLQTEGAVEAAIADGAPHAYLAALLAQPVASIRDDLAAQLAAWRAVGTSNAGDSAPSLIPPSLAKLSAMLAGEAAAPAHPSASWLSHYAHMLSYGRIAPGDPPAPAPLPDGSTPPDPAWHLLRLALDPRAPLAPLPPRELPPMAPGSSWVRLTDYSLAWQLRLVVGELLALRPPNETEELHQAYLAQLEMTDRWHELVFAASALPMAAAAAGSLASADAETPSLAALLCRLPLPDEPPEHVTRLLDLCALDEPAPLTAAAETLAAQWAGSDVADNTQHPRDPHRLLALLHASQAQRASYQRRPAAVVRHYLSAAAAARAADAAYSSSASSSAAAPSVLALLSDCWHLAHRALTRELIPPFLLGGAGLALAPDAARALGALGALVPPKGASEWAKGGRPLLEFNECMAAYVACTSAIASGQPEVRVWLHWDPRPLRCASHPALHTPHSTAHVARAPPPTPLPATPPPLPLPSPPSLLPPPPPAPFPPPPPSHPPVHTRSSSSTPCQAPLCAGAPRGIVPPVGRPRPAVLALTLTPCVGRLLPPPAVGSGPVCRCPPAVLWLRRTSNTPRRRRAR